VASIHAQQNRAGDAFRVRHDGRQRSLTFENLPAARARACRVGEHANNSRCEDWETFAGA
jgi:hypothetical protein